MRVGKVATRAGWTPAIGSALEDPERRMRGTLQPVASFPVTYRRERLFVLRRIRQLGVPADQVDDAAQEVFMVLHEHFERLDLRTSLRPWLHSVVRRVCANRKRMVRRFWLRFSCLAEPIDLDDISTDPDAPPEAELERREMLRHVSRALQALPAPQRDVFLLARIEQRTLAEIGGVMNISSNTAASRLRMACARLERTGFALEDAAGTIRGRRCSP
jgi:RNA polymerase sigma-70 factor, ECF subfamily